MYRKIFSIAAALLPALLFSVSCEEQEPGAQQLVKLDPPQPAAVVGQTTASISWEPVEGAVGYAYYMTGDRVEEQTRDTSVELDGLDSGETYTIMIRALSSGGEEYHSDWAAYRFTTASRPAPTFEVTVVRNLPTEFTVRVVPSYEDATWYAGMLVERAWIVDNNSGTREDPVFDPAGIREGDLESFQGWASLGGMPLSQYLSNVLYMGTRELTFNDYILPGTENVFYVYGMNLDGTFTTELDYEILSAPAVTASGSNVKIEAVLGTKPERDILITYTPDADVAKYFTTFSYRSQIESVIGGNIADPDPEQLDMLIADMIDTGTPHEGAAVVEDHRIVDPGEDFCICVAGYDNEGGRFFNHYEISSQARQPADPVDSRWLEELAGTTWSVEQTLVASTGEQYVTRCTAEITSSALSMDYTRYNELALQLINYAGMDYNYIEDLELQGFSEKDILKRYGPKVILTFGNEDDITIDATEYQTPVYVSQYGVVYMKPFSPDTLSASDDTVLNVTMSDDGNTMTISSPTPGYWPSLVLYTTDWTAYTLSMSDIVLTRVD